MDAPVVAVLSLKGGVGKTTVTLGLASAARHESRRVLVVDLDPQGNATAGLNLAESPAFTTSDVLYDGRTGVGLEAITSTGWGSLVDAIPAERALEHRAVPSGTDPVRRLQRALHGAADRYDMILLDCPPSLGELTRNALFAATQAVVVTEPSYFAVQGAAAAVEAVEVAGREGNSALRVTAIVPNRARLRLSEHQYRLAELHAAFGDTVTEPVSERTAIQQAQGAGVPIHDWKSSGARSAARTFDDLLGRVADISGQAMAQDIAAQEDS
ncbi:MAG: ParA family protein [Candidatus Nanopelagicales bacterium]|jgi:cellulose biosynthesis protein BcsQ|nr:ParA family protein [Candidatus Nanopelagicales bacterium]